MVEAIGIGSRIDAVLDFCLDSPFQSSSSMRFWNIVTKDSLKVQLQQRLLSKDFAPKIVEAPLDLKSRSKAIILVASAGYGSDHIAAIDILRALRSTDGFSVAIVLKPFSFEGQRRQDEETHRKLIDMPQNNAKELKVSEITKILESFEVAEI